MYLNAFYYKVNRFIPRWLLISVRRQIVIRKRAQHVDVWPIDESAGKPPEGWKGWPDGKKFALVLTHDVETAEGLEKVVKLAELEMNLGFRSTFNFVAEDYEVPAEIFDYLRSRGFEVGVHGLSHKGNLFGSREKFRAQAVRINQYLKKWGAVGFRTPSMFHNLGWIHDLDIAYDSSTFDTDPFEPQADGVGAIFPFKIQGNSDRSGYIEVPYTLPQDFTLFVLMRENGIDIWKRKLDWIVDHGGMALLITHPDYMHFEGESRGIEEYPVAYYEEFLRYIKDNYKTSYWHALPREIADFFGRNPSNKKVTNNSRKPRMRVCMLSYSFYENDNRVMRYAESLSKRGDHVDVIALRKNGQPVFETHKDVNVYRIQKRVLNEKGKFSYLKRLLGFLINSWVFLSREHFKNPYNLIHVHSVPDFEVFAGLLPKLSGAKLILDIHDIVPEFYMSKFNSKVDTLAFKALVAIEKASIRFSDHVIISNHIWQQKLCSRSVKKDKCTVILNYPDQSIFFRRTRVRDNSKFIMMYPGTLNWHQGLDIAIKAFSMIKERAPEAEFHIYGGGSEIDNLRSLVSRLGLQESVFLKTSLPIDQIAEVMANADLGVIPKRNDPFGGEAFSTKILEFMCLGIPVVVAGTKVDKYYFNDSVVKFFKPGDENDLAGNILLLIRNKDLRERLAANALEFVEEYTWDKREDEYLKVVDTLTGNSQNQRTSGTNSVT